MPDVIIYKTNDAFFFNSINEWAINCSTIYFDSYVEAKHFLARKGPLTDKHSGLCNKCRSTLDFSGLLQDDRPVNVCKNWKEEIKAARKNSQIAKKAFARYIAGRMLND